MKNLLVFVLLCSPLSAQSQMPPAATMKVDYLKDVRPILSQNCYSCHGPEVQQSGLRLDLRQNALRGGDYGPVIIPGNSATSKLIRRLVDGDGGLQMPPTGAITDEQIGILRAWIDQGVEFRTEIAEDAAPKPVDPKVATFIAAIRSGDRRTMEKMIAADPEILKMKDAGGSTGLHHAAGFGTLDTVTLLLDKGADVNAKNRRSATPLHWAVHDEAKVRLLLSRGASINAKQNEGRTPLYQASLLGSGNSTVKLLLEKGADPNVASMVGMTPLMNASVRADTGAMALLIEKGADIRTRNGAGETALMFAATNGSPQAVKLLLDKGADATVKSKRSETALGNAATAGVEETVKLLLDHGADVNVRNIRGYSPLMLAASSDTTPAGVVRALISKGADTSFAADYDETARMLASKRGNTDVTALLGGVDKDNAPREIQLMPAGQRQPISTAVEKAMALLEKQSYTFIRTAGCNSCHSQDLPSVASGLSRDHGLTAREIPQLPASMMPPPERIMDFDIVNVSSIGWQLYDFGMNHMPRTAYTDAVIRYIKAMQTPEGNWLNNESRRPPMNAGDFQAAALAIYSLKQYGPPLEKSSTDTVIAKAVKWLENAKPSTTQDRAFHLLGLAWGNGSSAAIRDAARALAAAQRPDGGWNQLPGMASDAYATGEALYALNAGGKVPLTDGVYQKGVDYLMRTQASDGSWHVVTRSIWLQPYFESGFPYGRDQFISAAGTAWATMALAPVAERPKSSQRRANRK
jgi:ankyrin repeat protein/mono/diheme cytochrome c family protein